MPKGTCSKELYFNPRINKPIEEIWEDIQLFSAETFSDELPKLADRVCLTAVLPPLNYEGKFVKGLYLSNCTDCIYKLFPGHEKLFNSMAYSMWSSLPWSEYADIYLTSYKNTRREEWFKNRYPDKETKTFIGLQDADFINEYVVAPANHYKKNIDVLVVSRLSYEKNLPLLVKALKTYENKFKKKLTTVLVTGQKRENFSQREIDVIEQMSQEAGSFEKLKEYIEFVSNVSYGKGLNSFYSRAKCTVLTSIFEGKNRALTESMLCNTPVVVFKDLCVYTRGEDEIFPEGAGVYAEDYTPEALADSIHYVVNNHTKFSPRRAYLKNGGRLYFANKCIDLIPYYRDNLPEYEPGKIQENLWLKLAMWDNYQMSYYNFLYGYSPSLQHMGNLKDMEFAFDFYFKQLDRSENNV